MHWFVSNQGSTVGPLSAEDVRAGIDAGRVTRGMHVRDENGAWTPIEQSPFAPLLPQVPDGDVAIERPAVSQSRSNAGAGCLTILLIIGAWAWISNSCSSKDEPKRDDAKTVEDKRLDAALASAWGISQQFVEDRLKSPGTADYGSILKGTYQSYTTRCRELERDKQYRCSGWVDSQNTFGAVVRTNWDMTVEKTGGDRWKLVELHNME